MLAMIETKTYTDGTVVTGCSPLPNLSPKQQDRKAEAHKDFKHNLIYLRSKAGLTQSQLEARAGLPAMVLSHYETGKRKPGLDNIIALCKGLNCTATELLGV
jgi:DNA-binding XRE family transcriptional regulator